MHEVALRDVSIRHGEEVALDGASLTAPAGSLVALVGASGSGKTSVLRAIAGLEHLETGSVLIGGRDMCDVPPGDRGISMTFQRPALFSHRTAAGNIGFPLELRQATAQAIADRVGLEARALQIEHLLEHDVATLSVGEAQLVQIARAVVRMPAVLLLDEPFAAIEGERVHVLRRELRLLQQGFGVTTIMSTNDPQDAMAMADRLIVLDRGRVVQHGTPTEVYEQPATAMAAHLLGSADVATVVIELDADGAWIVHPAFRIRAWQPALRRLGGRRLQLVTRPEWWEIDDRGTITAEVDRLRPGFGWAEIVCALGDHRVTVRTPLPPGRRPDVHRGSTVRLRLRHWVLLDPRDGCRVPLDAAD